jgi:hypothetical protein
MQVSSLNASGKPSKTMTFNGAISSVALPCYTTGGGSFKRWDACCNYLTLYTDVKNAINNLDPSIHLTDGIAAHMQFTQITVVVYPKDRNYPRNSAALWLVSSRVYDFDNNGALDSLVISHPIYIYGKIDSQSKESTTVSFSSITVGIVLYGTDGTIIGEPYTTLDVPEIETITCICTG